MNSPAFTTRWWVPPPCPDETLASLVSRAGRLYHSADEALWQHLAAPGEPPLGEMDAPTTFGLLRLGRVLGLRPSALVRHRIADAPYRLAPSARAAVCPTCVAEDAAQGEPARYRGAWSRVLTPVCPVHGAPLRLASGHLPTAAGNVTTLTDAQEGVLALIHRFGHCLEQALFFGGTWPAEWHGDPYRARAWILRACEASTTDAAPVAYVLPEAPLLPWVRGPRRNVPVSRQPPWDRFRHIADPAFRRAALWVGAWLAMPNLPARASPGMFDWDALTQASRGGDRRRDRRQRLSPSMRHGR